MDNTIFPQVAAPRSGEWYAVVERPARSRCKFTTHERYSTMDEAREAYTNLKLHVIGMEYKIVHNPN